MSAEAKDAATLATHRLKQGGYLNPNYQGADSDIAQIIRETAQAYAEHAPAVRELAILAAKEIFGDGYVPSETFLATITRIFTPLKVCPYCGKKVPR